MEATVLKVTKYELEMVREMLGCSMREAAMFIYRTRLSVAIDNAASIDDIKGILHAMTVIYGL